MAAQPRLLTTLPSDVLREILGFVLDEPNGPSRSAVLLVGNSLLNELGTPLLFKHLRLATYTSWEAHFGVGGYLTSTENGGKGMGKFVKQLELDRLDARDSDWSFPISPTLQLSSVHTLTLSHTLVETWTLYPGSPFVQGGTSPLMRHIPATLFSSIFTHLPNITTLKYLVAQKDPYPNPPSSGRHKHHLRPAISTLLGLTQPYDPKVSSPTYLSPIPSDPFPFPLLRTVHYVGGMVLDNGRGSESIAVSGTAFAMLPMVENLIVEFHRDENRQLKMDWIYKALIVGSLEDERRTRWKGLKRLEIRRKAGGGKAARLVEKWLRKSWVKSRGEGRIAGMDSCEVRLAPLVVFADEDGTERRLVE